MLSAKEIAEACGAELHASLWTPLESASFGAAG
jgi:hypothetical protein